MPGFLPGRGQSVANAHAGKSFSVALLAIATGLLSLLLLPDNAMAQSADSLTRLSGTRSSPAALFARRYYVGVGAGLSWLDPDTSEVEGVDPNKRSDSGFQLSLGVDFSPLLSFELTAASLGEARLSSGEEIEYSHAGLSSLIYFGGARKRFNRQGFTGFARVGLGTLIIDADDSVPFSTENDVQVTLGVGFEYAMSFGLALRAEAMTFDADAYYTQLGLIYRFGPPPVMPVENAVPRVIPRDLLSQPPSERRKVPSTPTPRAVLALGPIAENTVAASPDLDNDGIMNSSDDCDDTLPGLAVDKSGCAIIYGVLEGVTFKTGSSELTPAAKSSLDDVAQVLLLSEPSMMIELSAHTDNVGAEKQNKALSVQRVKVVARYLISKGVGKSRFALKASGETHPVASNDTEKGRQANRRVEIKGLK